MTVVFIYLFITFNLLGSLVWFGNPIRSLWTRMVFLHKGYQNKMYKSQNILTYYLSDFNRILKKNIKMNQAPSGGSELCHFSMGLI